jgi:hypothetical protein
VSLPIRQAGVERIDNPIEDMKKLGVTFHFKDLGLPENEELRNYF